MYDEVLGSFLLSLGRPGQQSGQGCPDGPECWSFGRTVRTCGPIARTAWFFCPDGRDVDPDRSNFNRPDFGPDGNFLGEKKGETTLIEQLERSTEKTGRAHQHRFGTLRARNWRARVGAPSLPAKQQGMVVLGTPLGSDAFVDAFLKTKTEFHAPLFSKIPAVPDLLHGGFRPPPWRGGSCLPEGIVGQQCAARVERPHRQARDFRILHIVAWESGR